MLTFEYYRAFPVVSFVVKKNYTISKSKHLFSKLNSTKKAQPRNEIQIVPL
jgi:hypothetical protein